MDRRANLMLRFRALPVPDLKPICLKALPPPELTWLERAFQTLVRRLTAARGPRALKPARTAVATPRAFERARAA
jgi:hypothetical protein